MRRTILFVLLTVMLAMFVFPQDYDIRKLRWGMSFEAVKKAENLDDDFFKKEELLGIDVEVRFGFDYKGLYSVIYMSESLEFGNKAAEVLKEKYGKSKTGLDYSFLMQSKNLLERYPEVIVNIYETGDFSHLSKIKIKDLRRLVKNVTHRREKWESGNSVILLLTSPEASSISYWSKTRHYESKKKFIELINSFKEILKKDPSKKSGNDSDKF